MKMNPVRQHRVPRPVEGTLKGMRPGVGNYGIIVAGFWGADDGGYVAYALHWPQGQARIYVRRTNVIGALIF